jgi:imidazolonepropionase-like amidohydrolase
VSLQIEGGTVFDGVGDDVHDGWTVIVEGSKIVGIGANASTPGPRIIDAGGLTVLPGLIDAHTHVGCISGNEPDAPPAVLAAQIFENCRIALEEGFTTIRDLGGIDGAVAKAVKSGFALGPRILPSGPKLSPTGGAGDKQMIYAHGCKYPDIPGLTQMGLVADGVDGMRAAARQVLKQGATQLKISTCGGFTPGPVDEVQFALDEIRAVVGEANAQGKYVTAHAHYPKAILHGLKGGVTCFEHGTFLDEESADALLNAGMPLIATLMMHAHLIEDGPALGIPNRPVDSLVDTLNSMHAAARKATKFAFDSGIRVGSGSDMLGPRQQGRGREIVVKADVLTPLDAIRSATSINASIVGIGALTGSLENGKQADVIGVAGDPFANPELLKNGDAVRLVVLAGEVIKDLDGRAGDVKTLSGR